MESKDFLFFHEDNGTKQDDTLLSEKFIKDFHFIVTNNDYSVYALTGDWGSGKTSFIKMWENILTVEKKQFVHIDAFKSDYESDPFIMLLKAFKKKLQENQSIDKQKFQDWLSNAKKVVNFRSIGKLGINILLDKTIGLNPVKDFLNDTLNSTFDLFTSEKSLYDELQSTLNELLNKQDVLYIIIDELDRCRPDFALETLEKIKHIFNVNNVKYIIVYNENILSSIIKSKYGNEINANKYLQKFVQKKFILDNKKRQLRQWYMNEVNRYIGKNRRTEMSMTIENCNKPFLKIAEQYGLGLRNIQHLLFSISHYEYSSDNMVVTLLCYEILKIIEKENADKMYKEYLEYEKSVFKSPSRVTFYKLFKYFNEFQSKDDDYFDELFYNLMKYIELH
jgi:energy-coupling factor transporter ATP-binding protein EcfA2